MSETSIKPGETERLMPSFDAWRVWENPIVWKNYRSRMRMQALFNFLLVFIISSFMTFTIYGGVERFQGDTVMAARSAIAPLGILQWIILMLSATGRITSGIIHERVTDTIEYTRLTPLSPLTKVIGYLFGLPVREYLILLMTMPFMIFLLIVGEIPLSVVIPVYLVFFSSAILFHMLGMVLGLVMMEWRLSVVLTIGLVIAINWVLPFFAYLGFPFVEYLTVRPVFFEKIGPFLPVDVLPVTEDVPQVFINALEGVQFYNWEVSTTGFCLILQGLLIFTLGLMVYRKWEDDFGHSLSKLYALFFFVSLQIFCIGTLWRNLTLDLSAVELLTDDSFVESFAFIIPLIYCFFSLAVAIWLIYIVTPSHEEYRSGLLRSQKLQQTAARKLSLFDDNAGSLPTTALLAVATFVFILIVQLVMSELGPLRESSLSMMGMLRMPLVAMLVIFYFAVSVEYLQIGRFALLFLMIWIVPILLAIFLAVVFEMEENVVYIASGSPFTLIILAAQGLVDDWVDIEDMQFIRNAYLVGFSFVLFVTTFLGYQLKRQKDRTRQLIENRS